MAPMTSTTLAWIYLAASGIVDVAWALAMKKADGFANPLWSAVSLVLLALFVYLLKCSLSGRPTRSGRGSALPAPSSPGSSFSPSPLRRCASSS